MFNTNSRISAPTATNNNFTVSLDTGFRRVKFQTHEIFQINYLIRNTHYKALIWFVML
jgi:hypothetical protein